VVDGRLPAGEAGWLRVGVDRDVDFGTLGMGVTDAVTGVALAEIQAGERARVGVAAKAHVDGVGAVVDGPLEGGQITGGADEVHLYGSDPGG